MTADELQRFRLKMVEDVFAELRRAESKYPGFPVDPLHAVAVLGEEYGELVKAVRQRTYEPQKSAMEDVVQEAVQTAAMALRFLFGLSTYQFVTGMQVLPPTTDATATAEVPAAEYAACDNCKYSGRDFLEVGCATRLREHGDTEKCPVRGCPRCGALFVDSWSITGWKDIPCSATPNTTS